MITEGRYLNWLPLHMKIASPYVDRFVFVEDGTMPSDALKYLKKYTNKDVVLLTRKWDGSHVKQRNVYIDYLKKEGGEQWCIVMDSDEFPSKELLSLELQGDGMLTPSHDVLIPSSVNFSETDKVVYSFFFGSVSDIKEDVPPSDPIPDEVRMITKELGITTFSFKKQFGFKKLNIFKINKSTEYIGTVHEALTGQTNLVDTNAPYFHIKHTWEIHFNGSRNYVEGGSGVNLGEKNPHWIELKDALGHNDWHIFRNEIKTPPSPLLLWIWAHLGEKNCDWCSENFDIYMMLQYATKFPFLPYQRSCTEDWITDCNEFYLYNPSFPEVEKAYRHLLHRDPDPASKGYIDAFYNISFIGVIRDILNSVEYKNTH